jgi:hypothetical protein
MPVNKYCTKLIQYIQIHQPVSVRLTTPKIDGKSIGKKEEEFGKKEVAYRGYSWP